MPTNKELAFYRCVSIDGVTLGIDLVLGEGQIFQAQKDSMYLEALLDNGIIEVVYIEDGDWVVGSHSPSQKMTEIGLTMVPCT